MSVSCFYPALSNRALVIVSALLRNCSFMERKEISHDITVDFLFFSRSLKETFDPAKGDLMPFFSSYVRRKCRGLYDRQQRDLSRRISLEDIEMLGANDDAFLWFEVEARIKYIRKVLLPHSVRGVCLSRLFGLCLICIMEYGSIKFAFLMKRLKKNKAVVKEALDEMKALIKAQLEESV